MVVAVGGELVDPRGLRLLDPTRQRLAKLGGEGAGLVVARCAVGGDGAWPYGISEIKDKDGRVIAYEPNPGAENVLYLKGGFDWYMKRLGGKTRSWIRWMIKSDHTCQ